MPDTAIVAIQRTASERFLCQAFEENTERAQRSGREQKDYFLRLA